MSTMSVCEAGRRRLRSAAVGGKLGERSGGMGELLGGPALALDSHPSVLVGDVQGRRALGLDSRDMMRRAMAAEAAASLRHMYTKRGKRQRIETEAAAVLCYVTETCGYQRQR